MHDVRNYIRQGKLWQAFTAPGRVVLLIDEIDKADIEFPNDCCRNSTGWSSMSTRPARPCGRRTDLWSSSPRTTRKDLPDAFLRAASFTTSDFPMRDAGGNCPGPFPRDQGPPTDKALSEFLSVRDTPGLKKKPSTSKCLTG